MKKTLFYTCLGIYRVVIFIPLIIIKTPLVFLAFFESVGKDDEYSINYSRYTRLAEKIHRILILENLNHE